MPRGFSLIELVATMTVAGILLALAVPRWAQFEDGVAVRQAALEVATFYQAARHAAIRRATRVRIELQRDSLRAVFEGATDSTFLVWAGPSRHGVGLDATRAVIRLNPTGLGYGAANSTIVLQRGAVAESLTTSRLGRLKRW
jgi:prepilin-type N-terminal cleavage/methylation domain-containing protein